MGYTDVVGTAPAFGGCASGAAGAYGAEKSGSAPAFSGCIGAIPVPNLVSVTPSTLQAGQTYTLDFVGTGLDVVNAVNFSGTLITVNSIVVVSSVLLHVNVTLDILALEGLRTVSVSSVAGTSGTVPITVTPGMWLGITTEPALWVEADFGIADIDGANLTQWNDRSSRANHMTVAPTKGAPVYHATGWKAGLKPYLQFNNAHGIKTAFSASLFMTSHTVFVVALRDPSDANSSIVFIISDIINLGIQDSAASTYVARWNAGHTVIAESSYHNVFGWIPLNTRLVFRHQFDGTHAGNQVFLNGAFQGLTNQLVSNPGVVNTGASEVRLGYRDTSLPGFDIQGRIAACVVYNAKLSPADTAIVEAQLSAKWL